jgi:hypothetical protein
MAAGPGGIDWVLLAVLVSILAAALAIHAAFLFTLMRCLARVEERNRAMTPGLVWLGLLPLFNHLWYLVMIPRVSNSLRNEWQDRGWGPPADDFGHALGMIYAIGTVVAACCSVGTRDGGGLSCVTFLIQLALLLVWIIYWVKIAGYSRRLGDTIPAGDEFADYDDEFRPRPAGRLPTIGNEDQPPGSDEGLWGPNPDDDRPRRDGD